MTFVVLVTGDRNWTNADAIDRRLAEVISEHGEIVVVHGACRGADQIAGLTAEGWGMGVRAHPANWAKYGNRAGPIRNRVMLDTEKPSLVLAFHPDIAASRGTRHMIEIANRAGVPVRLFAK